ncbi:MAG: tRNA 2-selenouridine(34) synthase MnmH [Bacteroidetes bacterium]|nr:tRNA 2-selenouridine(34) synthase MnmH [Bacteroidota bacterium]
MPTPIDIEQYVELAKKHQVFDVRTPAEYLKGHLPGSINLPLFEDEERAVVGKIYKHDGRQPAILKGLELVGPKLKQLIKAVVKQTSDTTILLYCWRGGMRSGSVAWLLEMYGYKVYTLRKGYKAYRNYVLAQFDKKYFFTVLGGYTGTGKTELLQHLQGQNQLIIDLEKLANHKGSSFGSLGEQAPPTQEHFENLLATHLLDVGTDKHFWVEDESRTIGRVGIPTGFWRQMRTSRVTFVSLSFAVRTRYLVQQYGKYSKEELITATSRIAKRLGGQHVKRAVEAIEKGDLTTACEINLTYYDKAYLYGLSERDKKLIIQFEFVEPDLKAIAQQLIQWKKLN